MSNVATDVAPNTDHVVALVRRWLAESGDHPAEPAAERLAGVLKDPNGLAFTVGFVDGVMRPEDLGVAGRNLEQVAKLTPKFLPWYLRAAVRVGGFVAPAFPWVVVPIARRVLRNMVGHLVLDATPAKLGPAIATPESRSPAGIAKRSALAVIARALVRTVRWR